MVGGLQEAQCSHDLVHARFAEPTDVVLQPVLVERGDLRRDHHALSGQPTLAGVQQDHAGLGGTMEV